MSRSVSLDGSTVIRPRPAAARRGARGGEWLVRLGQPEADAGHVPVDGLVVARANLVGLVPDHDVARVADALVELLPRGQVRGVRAARVALQVLERAPV